MVHHSQVPINPFQTTIMICISLHIFHKVTFVALLYVDVDEFINMSLIYLNVVIDMSYR
jgi:hypothetical protein